MSVLGVVYRLHKDDCAVCMYTWQNHRRGRRPPSFSLKFSEQDVQEKLIYRVETPKIPKMEKTTHMELHGVAAGACGRRACRT